MSLFGHKRHGVTETFINRTYSAFVQANPEVLPHTPILLETWVESGNGDCDINQLAFSIPKAKQLQHALLKAINEAERGLGEQQ